MLISCRKKRWMWHNLSKKVLKGKQSSVLSAIQTGIGKQKGFFEN
jgi:hypothetical protein